jgi:hypothetical protein
MQNAIIRPCTIEHLDQYGAIYAAAFSGEPWNDDWYIGLKFFERTHAIFDFDQSVVYYEK